MSELPIPSLALPLCAGQAMEAVYLPALVPAYRDHPLIEALPPIWAMSEVVQQLSYYPEYVETQRTLPAELRLHLIQNAVRFFEPLPIHLDLEQRFSRVIRTGYLARHPLQRQFWAQVHGNVQQLAAPTAFQNHGTAAAVGFTIVGISGVGKTTAVEAILRLYPQVIFHHTYHDQPFAWTQVVWLKLDCPFDGSIRGLCLNFFQALDNLLGTRYYQGYARYGHATTDEMLPHIARVGSIHSLGVLVIDEIQNLSEAHSGGAPRMLNFFVQLVNTIGVPVVLVGTYKALPLLTGEFRQARRGAGQGDMVWERMAEDAIWQLFCEALWRYQYLQQVSPLTPELSHTLYDISQGITDFAVKGYMLAQIRAITSAKENLTPNILRSIATDSLQLANPVLTALRNQDYRMLRNVADVQPFTLTPYLQDAWQSLAQRKPEASPRSDLLEPSPPAALSGPAAPVMASPTNPTLAAPHATSVSPLPPPAPPTTTPISGQLQQIVGQPEPAAVTAYARLQSAGYICHANEFLKGDPAHDRLFSDALSR